MCKNIQNDSKSTQIRHTAVQDRIAKNIIATMKDAAEEGSAGTKDAVALEDDMMISHVPARLTAEEAEELFVAVVEAWSTLRFSTNGATCMPCVHRCWCCRMCCGVLL